MLLTLRVLSSLSLLILLLHACSYQGGNLAAAVSNHREATKENGLRGRKMESDYITRQEKEIQIVKHERTSMISRVTRKMQGETASVNGQQIVRSLLPEEKDMSGFVAFNADYKGPKRHPPKNN